MPRNEPAGSAGIDVCRRRLRPGSRRSGRRRWPRGGSCRLRPGVRHSVGQGYRFARQSPAAWIRQCPLPLLPAADSRKGRVARHERPRFLVLARNDVSCGCAPRSATGVRRRANGLPRDAAGRNDDRGRVPLPAHGPRWASLRGSKPPRETGDCGFAVCGYSHRTAALRLPALGIRAAARSGADSLLRN